MDYRNFAVMRIVSVLILLAVGIASCSTSKNASGAGEGQKLKISAQDSLLLRETRLSDVIPIKQISGETIHIVGVNTSLSSYTETEDGYTLMINYAGLFEYAINDRDGNLVESDRLAHDPDKRSDKEKKQLESLPKHKRQTGRKLAELIVKYKLLHVDAPKKDLDIMPIPKNKK